MSGRRPEKEKARRSDPRDREPSRDRKKKTGEKKKSTHQPTLQCPVCQVSFQGDRATGRDRHLQAEHALQLKWACKFCPTTVGPTRFRDLARHAIRVHSRESDFWVPIYSRAPRDEKQASQQTRASPTASQQKTTASQQQKGPSSSQAPGSQQPHPSTTTVSQQPRRRSPRQQAVSACPPDPQGGVEEKEGEAALSTRGHASVPGWQPQEEEA